MITLRDAIPDDLETLLYWDQQEHVIACDPDDAWNWAEELQKNPSWRRQLMAELEGIPIGFVQIINPAQEETHYWGEITEGYRAIDIWIGSKENLGKGYGTQMMKLAIDICFQDPDVQEILIDPLASNLQAIRFYEKLGFIFREDRIFEGHLCKVYAFHRHKIS